MTRTSAASPACSTPQSRTTALNEQALRRISADLHDGPAQVLALASLRLDSLGKACGDSPDFAIVHDSLRDALDEVRAISRGLRLPELETVPMQDVLQRAIGEHERRTCSHVTRVFERLPEMVPLAVKIGAVRTLQERCRTRLATRPELRSSYVHGVREDIFTWK